MYYQMIFVKQNKKNCNQSSNPKDNIFVVSLLLGNQHKHHGGVAVLLHVTAAGCLGIGELL